MTNVEQLVSGLRARGVALAVEGNSIRITAPHGVVGPGLRRELAQRKADVMDYLRRESLLPLGVHRQRIDGRFRFVDGLMSHGDICWGWTPATWAAELRRKAGRCDEHRPDIATYYRAWAADIERRLDSRT